MTTDEKEELDEVFQNVQLVGNEIIAAKEALNGKITQSILTQYKELLAKLKLVSDAACKFVPPLKSDILEMTDKGPGVSVSNRDVKYRMAERFRIHNLDRYGRMHMARDDNGKNEAERSNAAIGNAICDGGSLDWEYYKPFDGNEQAIEQATPLEFDEEEDKTMRRNVRKVCEDLCYRVDDAPGPAGDYMKAYVTPDQPFFFDRKYLDQYIKASKLQKVNCPGHGYYGKLEKDIEDHAEVGDMYIEFLKGDCRKHRTTQCQQCSTWISPSIHRCPKPFPDYQKLPSYQYLPPEETPIEQREVDDTQPRVQLKKLHKSNPGPEEISNFCDKYIIDEQLARKYLSHLDNLQRKQDKRTKETLNQKQQKLLKGYEEYDWAKLSEENTLRNLFVPELNKHLIHNKLEMYLKDVKEDKVGIIHAHIGKSLFKTLTSAASSETSVEDNSGSDESSSEADSEDDENVDRFVP